MLTQRTERIVKIYCLIIFEKTYLDINLDFYLNIVLRRDLKEIMIFCFSFKMSDTPDNITFSYIVIKEEPVELPGEFYEIA